MGIEDCLHIEFEYDKSKYHLEVSVDTKSVRCYVSFCHILTEVFVAFNFYACDDNSSLISPNPQLQDVVIGKIYFQLVRIKIKCMELGIVSLSLHLSDQQHTVRNDNICILKLLSRHFL